MNTAALKDNNEWSESFADDKALDFESGIRPKPAELEVAQLSSNIFDLSPPAVPPLTRNQHLLIAALWLSSALLIAYRLFVFAKR